MTSYGPGSILESIRGPRLIPRIERSGLFHQEAPTLYEIFEPALSQVLPERGRIFRLPSNAERECDDSRAIYETLNFPRWSLCARHGILYRLQYGERKGCVKCPAWTNKEQAWERAREQAVSFVMACPEGHLSDVPWSAMLHAGAARNCRPAYIEWSGAGGPLRGVRLRCPDCAATQDLAAMYHRNHHCQGRFLEKGSRDDPGTDCKASARICQRAASDLFLPEVMSALTLPRADSALHRALRNDTVMMGLSFLFANIAEPTEEHWQQILGQKALAQHLKSTLEQATLSDRNSIAREVLAETEPENEEDNRRVEFSMLRRAALEGLPRSDDFQMDAQSSQVFPLGSTRLRVTPANRLRMVMAQTGYRRLGGSPVDTAFRHGGNHWYPGVELFGEGIFLNLEGSIPVSESDAWQTWWKRFEDSGQPADHPMMIWWHTLSHRLIRALAVDSGYSAASVRERLYLHEGQGGVLLYAVQPGGDGTLGGLIALVPKFASVIAGALRHLDGCSNDPICGEQSSGNGQNGAACYACTLLSETACEMRNLSLDRRILVETLELGH